ncbi:retron-type reverse transcriptase [Bradyrhizobium sp. LM3.6]
MRQKKQIELNLGTGARGEAPKAAAQEAEARAAKASLERPAVAGPLMEAVVERENLKEALARVKRNKGAAGIDGMSVDELPTYLKEHWPTIRAQLLEGTYKPQPVRRVEIPKASGGTRPLGIPTVLDRFIQQAVLQVLQADWDGTFSGTSFGFRPKHSAHQAVEQAQAYIASGHGFVVDIDLEKFFDRVNHDILMGLVAKRVADKRLLKLIRGFLTAGVLEGGLVSATEEGTPQGGPLSPLLSNLMLDVLDKELEKRGHRFVRYADDCNIYVRSRKGRRAGDGRHREVPRKAPQAEGQQGQERGCQAERPQVPGLQLHRREGAAAAYRTAGDYPLQSESPGADATHVRTKPRTDRQGAVHLPCRLARILRLLPNPVGVERTRSVDQAAVARHRLEAVEAWSHSLCRTATPWCRPGSGGSNCRQPTWPLAVGGEPCA